MKPLWVATLAVIFLAFPTARAILPPDVTFIPAQISVNSSFLMIADPHPSPGESPTINWVIFGLTEYSFGGTQRIGDKWICLFSKTSDCSSVLFPYPSYDVPYSMQVNAQFGSQVENNTINVSVGGIVINTNIAVTGTNVYISAWAIPSKPETPGVISYKVYTSDTFSLVKSGSLTYNENLYGYTGNISLENGIYYIAFTSSSPTDFGGGIVKVTIGTTPGQTNNVQYDSITYSPVINAGQKFKIETFKITNIGTDNLTGLSVSVASELVPYLTITPKQASLEPNESTYLTVELQNIQTGMNISTFANLKAGSTQLAQIPVNLLITVYSSQNYSSCIGKADKDLCLGGMCCGEMCRVGGADCCTNADCSSDKECSSSFKCVPYVAPNECQGMSDNSTCSGGMCCSGQCVQCCTTADCPYGETCSSYNTCQTITPNECENKDDKATCTGGICCSGSCISGGVCCTGNDCPSGETCSEGTCIQNSNPSSGGIDLVTIGLIGGGVAAAAVVGFFVFKRLKKKGKEGDEELDSGEEKEDDEFSDEDFY